MKKKSKLRTILEAFSTDIPKHEDWFKERLEACEGCDYNSDNIDPDELSFKQSTQIKLACSEGSMCTACGCCLHEKLGQKTENCGLMSIGKTPKWRALAVETSSTSDINVEILNKSALSIDLDTATNSFVVRLGDVTTQVAEIELIVSRKQELRIGKIKVQCGCTTPVEEKIDNNSIRLMVKINTANFTDNQRFQKYISIPYFVGKGTKNAKINFIGHKKRS